MYKLEYQVGQTHAKMFSFWRANVWVLLVLPRRPAVMTGILGLSKGAEGTERRQRRARGLSSHPTNDLWSKIR